MSIDNLLNGIKLYFSLENGEYHRNWKEVNGRSPEKSKGQLVVPK
jgi:hypothetical protein